MTGSVAGEKVVTAPDVAEDQTVTAPASLSMVLKYPLRRDRRNRRPRLWSGSQSPARACIRNRLGFFAQMLFQLRRADQQSKILRLKVAQLHERSDGSISATAASPPGLKKALSLRAGEMPSDNSRAACVDAVASIIIEASVSASAIISWLLSLANRLASIEFAIRVRRKSR